MTAARHAHGTAKPRENSEQIPDGLRRGDEIPATYKDNGVVMADAADLVKVEHTLRQIINVKSD